MMLLANVLSLLIAAMGGEAQTPQAAEPAGIPVLVCEYEDGKVTYHTVRDGKGFLTPLFPRVGDPPLQKGHRLSALQVHYRRDADAVIASVSLIYGSPHQLTLPVKDVSVRRNEKVRIEELASFGVAPVTLSLVSRVTNAMLVPAVDSASTALAFDVRPPSETEPAYRVRVRNTSGRALLLFYVEAQAGGKGPMTTLKRDPRGAPLLDGGGETTFDLPVTGSSPDAFPDGTWAPRPIQRIGIKTVLWADGTLEGDREPLTRTQGRAAGTAAQLRRVLAIVDDAIGNEGRTGRQAVLDAITRLDVRASPALASELRARVRTATGGSPLTVSAISPIGMQSAKAAVLDDIRKVPGESSAEAFVAALMALRGQYVLWMQRMEQLLSF